MGRRRGTIGKVATLIGGAGLLLAACSSSTPASTSTKKTGLDVSGNLTVAVFNPFSGADASFGPLMMSGCIPAVRLINADGGVYGHDLTCVPVDTRGDPADAVPAANKLIATAHNLIMVIGPSSDEAAATVPIFNAAKIPMFPDAGDAEFDRSPFTYLWRLIPPDAADGYAQAIWAHEKGYTRAALIYASNVGFTNGPLGVTQGFPALGGKIVYSATLTPDQPTYESTITAMLAAHPQVILYEAGPRTSATFFAELKALGHLLPTIGPETIYEPQWENAVGGVVGTTELAHLVTIVEAYVSTSSPGWPIWDHALLASAAQVPDASSYADDPFSIANYDAVNIVALAILMTHTINTTVINNTLSSVITPGPGKVVCDSYAECKKDILAGDKIQYVGAGGPIQLNKWHNAGGSYHVITDSLSSPTTLGEISAGQVAALIGRHAS
jgi:ABC-type branched-subunit amino acid transport system substrate-binding protein